MEVPSLLIVTAYCYYCCVSRIGPLLYLSLSLYSCLCVCVSRRLFVAQGVGALHSLLPASLSEHQTIGQAFCPHQHQGTTPLRTVRALMPTLAVLPPHVCHRQKTGLSPLARTCSKTLGISYAPPHLASLIPLCEYRSRQNLNREFWAIAAHETQLSFVSVAMRVFRPAGRHMNRKNLKKNKAN